MFRKSTEYCQSPTKVATGRKKQTRNLGWSIAAHVMRMHVQADVDSMNEDVGSLSFMNSLHMHRQMYFLIENT